MKGQYNDKLSPEINAQLSRRARTVHIRKRMIAITGILLISIMILLGTSIRAFASSHSAQKPVYKYYTSVTIERGDTLWSLADKYIDGSQIDKTEYIKEMCELNHLQDTEIHAGEHIVVAYYSTDLQ